MTSRNLLDIHQVKIQAFRIARATGLFTLSRWLTRHSPKILCYHGFELRDEASFRPKLFMSGQLFEARLSTISKLGFKVVSLEKAVDDLYACRQPVDTVVITVDDGFYSFFTEALPALKRHGFPATVYVTSYYVEHRRPVFRLLVQYMFWSGPKSVISMVGLPCEPMCIDLSDATVSEKALWQIIDYGEQRCNESQRRQICVALGDAFGLTYDEFEAAHLMELMRPEQLSELAKAGVDIGLHTHRHRFPIDNEQTARAEITQNRDSLQRMVGKTIEHFCYPSGEFDQRQWPWLDDLQLRSSTTCNAGINTSSTPRHGLFRFLDGEDVHPIEFEAALCGFSDLLRSLLRRR